MHIHAHTISIAYYHVVGMPYSLSRLGTSIRGSMSPQVGAFINEVFGDSRQVLQAPRLKMIRSARKEAYKVHVTLQDRNKHMQPDAT